VFGCRLGIDTQIMKTEALRRIRTEQENGTENKVIVRIHASGFGLFE
jgi:hypothetical protein